MRKPRADISQIAKCVVDEATGGRPTTKQPAAKASSVRQVAHLGRLADGGGKPVRVDTRGDDLALLDALVADDYAPSRAEAYRQAMRDAHARRFPAKRSTKKT